MSTSLKKKLMRNSLFQKLFYPKDPLSLETFLLRVRIVIWLMLLAYFAFNAYNHYPKGGFHFHVYVIYVCFCLSQMYLLSKQVNDSIIGFLHMMAGLIFYTIVLQSPHAYLRLFLSSFPTLALFSLNGYPVKFVVLMTLGLIYLKNHFSGYLEIVYEPINICYQIPAATIESFVNNWSILFVLQVGALCFYQIIIRKMWNKYHNTRKNLEDAQHKLQETNVKLAESFEELNIKNKELKKALKSQDLFVACVSHELRNPLNVMLGNIEVLSTDIKEPNQAQILKTCKLCGEALLRQINNLLDVSKMNANKFELSTNKVDMISFLEKFWAFAKIGLEKKNLEGYLMVDRNLPKWLRLDEHRLHQVLDNLISNATKFTKQGSVRIIFRWIPGRYKFNSISLEEIYEPDNQNISTLSFSEVGENSSSRLPRGELKKNSMADLLDFICFKFGDLDTKMLEDSLPDSSESVDNFLRIEVADTGCGITPEGQSRLFQPFMQADSNISSIYGGTGLGLYIVKNIIEKMGGTIKLNSMMSVGTRFQIMIPIKEERTF